MSFFLGQCPATHGFPPICTIVRGMLAQDILKALAAPLITNFFTLMETPEAIQLHKWVCPLYALITAVSFILLPYIFVVMSDLFTPDFSESWDKKIFFLVLWSHTYHWVIDDSPHLFLIVGLFIQPYYDAYNYLVCMCEKLYKILVPFETDISMS